LTATNVSEFDFHLPEHLISQHARPRGQSRLMVVDRAAGTWRDDVIANLPSVCAPGDLLVVNDTRVFPARLAGRRDPSGGNVECFLLSRLDNGDWDALVSPGKHLGVGARAVFDDEARAPGVSVRMDVISRGERGRRVVRFAKTTSGVVSGSAAETTPDVDFASVEDADEAIDALGHVPLPPYIRRADTPEDRERYQTVYARVRGSIAAPTAGLHFDDALLATLRAAGVRRAGVTLHVGYGTFKPVTAERVEDHVVDPEPYEISATTANAIRETRARNRRVVAVGTTTTRALEHAASSHGGIVAAGGGVADNFLYPGYRFGVIDALVTNFHLPKSSLLMLVAAFGGKDLVLAAYNDAVARGYHFYSYGDAMVVV
jgi:S-adenosylmethionine:tRNA ribosyltransferase-isomerase